MGSSTRSVASTSDSSLCSLIVALKTRQIRRARATFKQTCSTTETRPEDDTTCSSGDASSAPEQEKKVRFAPKGRRKLIPSCRGMSSTEKAIIWYTAAERSELKRKARCAAAQLKAGCSVGVNRVFMNARYLACTSDKNETQKLLSNRDVLAKNTKGLIESLYDCDEDASRGLEELVSDLHRCWRAEIAKDANAMVVETSRQLSMERHGSFKSEDIAREYQEMTRTSVILARLLAEIDAIAAEQVV